LDAVQRQERLIFARVQRDAVGIIGADELTLILRPAMGARSEAASGKCQRQASVRKHLYLQIGRPGRCKRGHDREWQLDRRNPALGATSRHQLQRCFVVNVEMRASHEGPSR
jgi:hypothetical protein